MAGNTIRPAVAGPPRANTVRPPRLPEPAAAEPVAEVPAAPVPAAPIPVAEPTPEPAPVRKTRPAPSTEPVEWPAEPSHDVRSIGRSWSLFALLDRFTSLDGLFREGLPVRYLPKLLFVMLLTLLYIGNTHYGNRMNRNIQRLKQETEDLRADYTTLKSDYMEASKQSEVARKVAAIGLVESSSPPFRIAVPAGRLDEAELETMPVLTADTLAARAQRDSLASQRADSLQGQVHRQQLADDNDDAPELGAPPPGLADEETAPVVNSALNNNTLPKNKPEKAKGKNKTSSTKKSIAAQGKSAKLAKPTAKSGKSRADTKNKQ
jgi:hypothetical protein